MNGHLHSKPRALAGNVFGGPFIRGIIDAGFDVLVQLEHTDYGVRTSHLNFPGLDIRVGEQSWAISSLTDIDLMFTNPPCAPWSTAAGNKGGNWEEDPRLHCIRSLVEAGIAIKPKVWVWESVCTCFTKGNDFVAAQARLWMDAGYHTTVLLQNNMYLGAPQNRKRMFFIAHKTPLLFPPMTDPKMVNEVIEGVENLPGELSILFKQSLHLVKLWERSYDFGGKFIPAWEALGGRGSGLVRPGFLSQRLRGEEPCPVLFPINAWHPSEPRRLTYGELLALCGLPQTWQLESYTDGAISGLLSRCVLAPVGKWLGEGIRAGLDWDELTDAPSYRVIDIRKGAVR